MDSSGQTVIAPLYEDTKPFIGGVASVKKDGKWGAINPRGELIISPQYNAYFSFHDGLAVINGKGPIKYIDQKGQIALTITGLIGNNFKDGYAVIAGSRSQGVINKTGAWIIPPRYAFIRPYNSSLGGFLALKPDGKTLLLNPSGEETPLAACGWTGFYEDLLATRDPASCERPLTEQKYGFIDITGQWVIPPSFDFAGGFQNGYAPIMLDKKWGYINKLGEIIIAPHYKTALEFNNGLAPVQIRVKTSMKLSPLSEGEKRSFDDLKALAKASFKWGYINPEDEVKIDFTYDSARSFSEGLACVESNEKYGFINTKGNIIIPLIFNRVSNFENGYASVTFGEKQYYVTRNGTPIGFSYNNVY